MLIRAARLPAGCAVQDDAAAISLAPRGVGVVVEAEHLCMTLRGVRSGGTRTVTSALHGRLREDPSSRAEFFALVGAR